MSRALTAIAFLLFLQSSVLGQIYCPADVTTSCFSDLTIEECGNATVISANYHPSQIKFEDDNQTNSCNEGQVLRRFYIDVDYDNVYSVGEPFCIQTITLLYDALPLNIQFPNDIELTCADEVPVQSPTWSSHPCDLVGYTYEDEIFEFEAEACLKIVRHYTVINWCRYEDGGSDGFFEGTQIIKIIDETAPEIEGCMDVEFDAVTNCEANVSLTNSATDIGDCPSGQITWRVVVDLWGDGTDDLFYGPNQPVPFRLDPVANGAQITVVLPDALGVSSNKVVWKATDGCGNVRSCSTTFSVADNKAPTPYCYGFLSATLNGTDGHELVIPARLFDVDGVDNCSRREDLKISFSDNVNDTTRVVACNGTGFQFYRIYYTDEQGNQDFCEAFLFVIDNGTCANKFVPAGKVLDSNGEPISEVTAHLISGEDIVSTTENDHTGAFELGEQSIMSSYSVIAEKQADASTIDILDYKRLLDAALGKTDLDFYQQMVADLNDDGQVSMADLQYMRAGLTGEPDAVLGEYVFVSADANNMSEASTSISMDEYSGSFDFVGVHKGDLATEDQVASIGAVESVDLRLVVTDEAIAIVTTQSIDVPLFQMDFAEDITVQSVRSDINLEVSRRSDVDRLSNLTSDRTLRLNRGDALMTAEVSNLAGLSDASIASLIADFSWVSQSGRALSQINWEVVDDRSENESIIEDDNTRVTLSHTLVQDQLTVLGSNGRLITITDVKGNSISFRYVYASTGEAVISDLEHLANGLYFITVGEGSMATTLRFVKS